MMVAILALPVLTILIVACSAVAAAFLTLTAMRTHGEARLAARRLWFFAACASWAVAAVNLLVLLKG